MIKNYMKFNNWRNRLCEDRKTTDTTFVKGLFTAILLIVSVFANAQILINPSTDGGFENGTAFADNGWTAVNAGTNKWVLGTTPGWFTGSRGAFITNNTTTNPWTYSNSSANRSHIYKDVAFPAGVAAVNLSFDWRANGSDGNYDNLLVYIVNTTITPTTSGPTSDNTTTTGWSGYTNGTTGYFLLQRNGTATPTATTKVEYTLTAAQLAYVSGSTKRLVFVWKNDGSGGSNPPASIDNISLAVPTCLPASAPIASSITATGANLSWTAPTIAPSTGYQWEVRSSGTAGSGATGLADSGSTAVGTITATTSLLAANTTYILYVRSNCGSGDFSTWTASSSFTTPLSCYAPTTLTGVATSPTAANLSWVAPTTAPSTGYQWEVRSSGAAGSGATGLVDSGSTAAGVTSATTSLLAANSSYTLYVRSNCGAGDFSTWASSASFRTPCVASAFPVSNEGFNVAGLPLCWSASAISSTWAGIVGSSGDIASANSGAGFMEKNYSSSTAVLISMPIDFSSVSAQARIHMFMHRHASAHANDQYIVYVNTTPSLTGATQLLSLYSKTTTAPTVPATGWYRNFINIPMSFNGSPNLYILVEGKTTGGTSSYDLGIDDFKVEYAIIETLDFASVESPAANTIVFGNSVTVGGRVGKAGLTDVEPGLSGKADGIEAWIGISPVGTNSNPNTWTTWVPASHKAAYVGSNDEYSANIGAALPIGTYYYATRFSLNGGPYLYGGINATNVGGIWDGSTNNSGVLTVNPVPGDLCTNAISIVVGTTYDVNNTAATNSTDTPATTCGSFIAASKDLWYSIQVPANVNRLTLQTLTSTPVSLDDTVLQVYRGTCGSLVAIGCNDDDPSTSVTAFSLLNLTGLVPGEIILIRVWGYDSDAGSFKLRVSVPACAVESVWNGTDWSNGIPVTGVVATINGNYTGPGFTACSLDVLGTSQAVITSGGNLLINGLVNVASTATLTLESNANLVQTSTITNTGSIIVKRESAKLVRLDHTLWSSPVASQNLFAFSPNTLTNRFYTYATPTNTYTNTGLSGTTTFVKAKGYAVRAPNNHSETPATWLGTFTGVPNNGNASFTLVTTGTGFNLVGNPYPSVVDASLFTAGNATITGTLYFYAHTLTMNSTGTFPAGTNYALWNASGATAATLGTSGVPALVPNGKIQVGQGFLVKSATAGSVVFTNAMREGSNANQFFRNNTTGSEIERHRIWLNLSNQEGTAFNQILVAYAEGATQGVDSQFDGLSFGNEGSALSSKLEGADYTIQGRALPFSQNDVVSLGFKAITPGSYTISLASTDGLFSNDQDVYLKDNSNGSLNNLKTAGYTFVSNAGTFDDRFQIVYQRALGIPESAFNSNSVIAYAKNSLLNVQTRGNIMKSVSIFDIRGRLLFQKSGINAADFVVSGLSAQNQVLLLQVTSENDEVATIKVIF